MSVSPKYYCANCGWGGNKANYDPEGDGHCPECGYIIPGAITEEKCNRIRAELRRRYYAKIKEYEDTLKENRKPN